MKNKTKAWRKQPKQRAGYSNRVSKRHYVLLPVGLSGLMFGLFNQVGLINDKKEA